MVLEAMGIVSSSNDQLTSNEEEILNSHSEIGSTECDSLTTPLFSRESNEEESMASPKPLSRKVVWAYGTGHVLNDLTACCWFTYLLIFLVEIGLSPSDSAIVMLSGQVSDAIATLVVGRTIDACGHFLRWHFSGTLLVAVSFSSVFGGCVLCTIFGNTFQFMPTLNYSIFASIFNIGWAATQVSHMSLVNFLTNNSTSRVALNSCKNAFTMASYLCFYAIAYFIFLILPSDTPLLVQYQYRWMIGISFIFGFLAILSFYAFIKEPNQLRKKGTCKRSNRNDSSSWKIWFYKILYYQVGMVYLLTRLATNISQSFLPFFLVGDLGMAQYYKALIPAIIYLCSLLSSLILQEIHWSELKLKFVFLSGSLLWIVSGIIFYFISSPSFIIYILSLIIGIANAFMLVGATSMEGILVGKNLSGCAFVYGSLSFLDKVSCGIAIYIIQTQSSYSSSGITSTLGSEKTIFRVVLAFLPSTCAFLAAIITIFTDLTEKHSIETILPLEDSFLTEKLID